MSALPAQAAPAAAAAVPRPDPLRASRNGQLLLGLLLLIPLAVGSDLRLWTLFTPQTWGPALQLLADFYPPAHDPDFLQQVLQETGRTLAIATAGLTLAVLLAVPLGLLASRALSVSALQGSMTPLARAVRGAARAGLIGLRSVPELIWALLLVRIVGLGAAAGVLAIGLTYGGMLGKVYAEILESGEAHVHRTLLQNGASRTQALLWGLLPQHGPELLSYTVYRWECALRASAVLGFVGAGGLGQALEVSLRLFDGAQVATLLAVFVLLVALADLVGTLLRRVLL